MKNFLFIASIIAMSYSSNAQVSGKHIGSTGVGGDLSIQDNNGKMIPIGAKNDTKGTPLFLENWVNGSVVLKNGVKFNNSELNFSLYEDKLYFRRDNQFFVVDGIISEFYLESGEANKPFHFVSGYPSTNTTNDNTYFQVLADGGHYQLLKWQHKKIRDVYSYGGVNESEYVNQEAYYVFERGNKKIWNIGNKINALSIKNTLSIDESIWKAYSEKNNSNAKGEKSLLDFVTYLNAL